MAKKDFDLILADIVTKNDELETLKALQLKVAHTLDNTTSARDIGSLAKQLREITERITELGGSVDANDEITEIVNNLRAKGRAIPVR